MLRVFVLLSMMLVSNNLFAANQTRYISDDIFIYIHGGPGNNYRIVGSSEAGQPVSFLGETQNDYSKVVDSKGRTGWVKNEYLSSSPSFRVTLPKLQNSLKNAKQKLSFATAQNQSDNKQLNSLSSEVANLKKQLAKTSAERDKVVVKLEQVIDNQNFLKWREGGMIAGFGLILGLIITYLPKPQRRNKERWM